jgi:predicted permease
VRDPFVILQVALALSLTVGAALIVKTYRNLANRELGFSSGHLLTAEVALPYRKAGQHARIYGALVEHLRRLPGVESAAAASFVPLTPSEHVFPVQAGSTPVVFKFFTPGYFETLQTRVVEGASVAAGERAGAPSPVLVSATLARRLYSDERAVGKTLRRLNEDGSIVTIGQLEVPPFTVVGVVADVRETTLRREPTEIVYIPVTDPPVEPSIVPTNMTLVIRTAVPPLAVAASVRDAIAEVDPDLTVGQVRTMDAIVRAARAREAFVGVLLCLAATVSLFLGVVGVYGSVAHGVSDRTREIGIRMALGARHAEVVRMVVTGSMRAVLIGAALGGLLALESTPVLSALLFGVEPRDPAILLTVTAILLLAAIGAALLAARHATRVAPLVAMRTD